MSTAARGRGRGARASRGSAGGAARSGAARPSAPMGRKPRAEPGRGFLPAGLGAEPETGAG
eukprot:11662914-Alexandrium_andersonii.AAC.1